MENQDLSRKKIEEIYAHKLTDHLIKHIIEYSLKDTIFQTIIRDILFSPIGSADIY